MLKDNLFSLFYRRYTHFLYNKRYGNMQRFPGWNITLVFYLYEKLPLLYFKNSGHEGIIRVGFLITKFIRYVYLIIKPVAKIIKKILIIIRNILRRIKDFLKILKKGAQTKIPVSSKTVNFDNVILYQGSDYSNEHLYLYFERIKKIKGDYLFFVHLYPENMKDSDDIVYKDGWPVTPLYSWQKGQTYTHIIYLGDIPKGYYQIKLGIYNSQTFERLRIESTDDNSLNVGWKKIE